MEENDLSLELCSVGNHHQFSKLINNNPNRSDRNQKKGRKKEKKKSELSLEDTKVVKGKQ